LRGKNFAVILFLFATAILGPSAALAAPAPGKAESLVLLFTHDLHSHLEAYPTLDASGKPAQAGGFASLAAVIDRERAGNETRTLLADAGDFSMGTVFHTVRESRGGELVAMGMLGYDITTYGNHDFEKGPGLLARALEAAGKNARGRLPLIVASNTFVDPLDPGLFALRDAQYAAPVVPYAVLRRAGMKIGLFGLMGRDAASDVPQASPVVFTDPVETARKVVSLLREREKVDLVIALSHCGTWADKARSEDELLASAVPGIDVIVSGHTHTVLDPCIRAGDTVIVSAGAYCRYLGRLEVEKQPGGKVAMRDYRLVPITPLIPGKAAVAGYVSELAAEAEKTALEPMGYRFGQALAESPFSLPIPLDEANLGPVPAPSGLGNLVADAYRAAAGETGLAFQADGPIRAPLVAGKVTVNDAFRILSLGQGFDGRAGYPLLAFRLTGADVREVLETDPSLGPLKADARLQVSGMRASIDPEAPAFSRVRAVETENRGGSLAPLDEKALYKVVTNGYLVMMIGYLDRVSGGRLTVVPRDPTGEPLASPWAARLFDGPDGAELKEWVALARFLQSFPDTDGNGLPDVPATYARPLPHFVPAP